jgi:hypothetical protein
MVNVHYDESSTLRDARAHYFAVNGFGEDGGYASKWVNFKLGPVPFPFPNTRSRARALGYHDSHHILTGYDTDNWGEFEISAWEVGAGCGDIAIAWGLNLASMSGGFLLGPRRTFAAFKRGLRSRSLYTEDLEPRLAETVRDVRAHLGLDRVSDAPATARELCLFIVASVAGLVPATLFMATGVVAAPLVLLGFSIQRRLSPAT